MLVTISGLPGSGTSTASRAVADALGLDHVDGGQVFRAMAAERGVDLGEFGRIAEGDPTIDLELDTRLAERGRKGDVVLESRLAGWIAHNEGLVGLRVWMACDDGERARRVAQREGRTPNEARRLNESREASEAQRYLAYYGIDIADLGPYDLVVDTTITPKAEVAARVVAAARAAEV
ncbi:MAG TPA: AAA family ATPase [Iamia sp.]